MSFTPAPIIHHVVRNYATLPKSTFNADEAVIIAIHHDSEGGYGHHSFSGVAIDRWGKVLYAYSSGCSCNGSCGLEHRTDFKTLESDGESFDLEKLNPAEIDFASLQRDFSDYD